MPTDLNLATEENFPNELIRSVFLKSRKYEEVEYVLEMVILMLAPLKSVKSGPEYRRKILLNHYQTELKKRLQYLAREKKLRESERSKVRARMQNIDSRVADKVIARSLTVQKTDKAREALLNLQAAQQNLLTHVEHTEESKKFQEQIREFLKLGYSPAEALRKAAKGEIVSTITTPDNLISNADNQENQIKEDLSDLTNVEIPEDAPNSLEEFQAKMERLNQDILNQEPLTKKNPIRLDHDPNRNHKED